MARRRHFLIGITTASTIGIAGCSGTDLEDLQGESNNEESEDAGEQTGPEAAFEQYRTAVKNGDVDAANEVIYTDGDYNELDDSFETPDIETIEYEISEVSPTEYESQTGNDFAEERIELTETGGDDFAIIRWDEEFIGESEEERSFDDYFLLHQIEQEWLIVDFIGSARAESEDEETEEGPQEPVVDGIAVETAPSIRITVDVRNPTEESVERTVWIRVPDDDGNVLATDSQTVTVRAGETGAIPFPFGEVAWSGNQIDQENVTAVLTVPGAESPF